jgi:septal ring factor EnvC (AmiA/AmiB activator)
LNLRPPGYEPGELPGCSTPRRRRKDSITPVPWWTWLSLGIFLAAVVATAVFSAFAFGRLKRLTAVAERIQTRLDEVAQAAEELERRMARTQERMEELERHRARLETSIDRLRVLTSAVSDARGGVMGLRRRYLRK